MLEELKKLAECGHPWAEKRAKMALQIAEQYQGGGLDKEEYEQLMRDLIRTDKLESEADDLATKTLLVEAIYAVAQLA